MGASRLVSYDGHHISKPWKVWRSGCFPEGSSEGEDDDQGEDENPTDMGGGFELDDINLSSPFLHIILSNERPVVKESKGHCSTQNRHTHRNEERASHLQPMEEEGENM